MNILQVGFVIRSGVSALVVLFCWVTQLTTNGDYLERPSVLTPCWLPYSSARWWPLNFSAGIRGSRSNRGAGAVVRLRAVFLFAGSRINRQRRHSA
jgi:hypothetical protein